MNVNSNMEKSEDRRDLTEQELEEIDEIFNALDRNHNGYIEGPEIRLMLCGLGQNPTDEQISKLIDNAEKYSERKDGKLSYDEFVRLLKNEYGRIKTPEQEKAEILAAFRVFDGNGDGYIDADELKKVLCFTGSNITQQEAEEMVKEVDVDQDNRISYTEFVGKMMSGDCFSKVKH